MDLSLSKHDACASGVFNGEFCFAVLASDTANGTAQVVTVQGLHVFNFKRLQEKVVESKQGDGCKQVKSVHDQE